MKKSKKYAEWASDDPTGRNDIQNPIEAKCTYGSCGIDPAYQESVRETATAWIRVYGIVQGVGFRPFVSRIADRIGVTGSVANKGSYVEIFVNGTAGQQRDFRYALEHEAPERSAILKIDVSECENKDFSAFEIIESEREEGDIFVSPDIATCPKCRQELFDPANRRYMHPFINCTACGPRLTILDAMPYDRERTSMKEFSMCPECGYEYTHAETRRYDAQPVCCNDCGPEVYLIGRPERGRDAITFVRKAILDGQIIAVKGIGGFHLCCDAADEAAVSRLRRLKQRPAKPFAVMMKNLKTVHAQCELSAAEEEILDGHAKPIILLKKKPGSRLAPSVAPDNPNVGVMLPYAPVQMLLFSYNDDVEMTADSFVMTSGNVSGAPICRTDEDAIRELSSFCDIMLSHNRRIRLRADDSVMGFYEGEPYMIRRSRGYAPLPVMMDFPKHEEGFDKTAVESTKRIGRIASNGCEAGDDKTAEESTSGSAAISHCWRGQVVAVGGELKNTFCIGKNLLFYPSAYIGDMADVRTVQALTESITRMEELLEAKPELAVCDLHPKYNTTAAAESLGLPVLKVQHHYAHILSCMAENNLPPQTRVIGVSFDGTGYGTDGTIWGGELLLCDYLDFQRVGSIRPFLQIGGDASAREGWRIAVSMINALYPEQEAADITERLGLCEPQMQRLFRQMAERKVNAVVSTSAGRLFDAVSAILGIRLSSTFEGEASTTLQFRAEEYREREGLSAGDSAFAAEISQGESAPAVEMRPDISLISDRMCGTAAVDGNRMFETAEDSAMILPTDALVRFITEQRLAGEDVCRLAYLFHETLAEQIVAGCREVSAKTGVASCALSGGVFQNQLLLELCETGPQAAGLTVYRHRVIPPNDGGLALGQAAAGMAYLQTYRDFLAESSVKSLRTWLADRGAASDESAGISGHDRRRGASENL
ncbi:MAG: carbamoyltransferase HypF [Lachnospiraceae bacterium]|nr:carbamoyltransferase HypF [Lachnospiraceae bacterium]